MVEKLRKSFDSGGVSTAVLTDFSRTLYYLPPDLLIAVLNVYCVKGESVFLNFLFSYLEIRKQRFCLITLIAIR